MIVAQLIPEQAKQLKGVEFSQDLPLIEYLPKETTNLFDNV